jgi:hypothetical protein
MAASNAAAPLPGDIAGRLDPRYLPARGPQMFQAGDIRAVVDPRLMEYGVVLRADLLVLQMLKDNVGSRPLYFAHTSGNYLRALGLEPYALSQGLASKIATAPLTASVDTIAVQGMGYIDVARSLALWRMYGAPTAMVARGDWVDRPSASVPYSYVATSLLLGDALEHQGKTAQADSVRRSAMAVAQATRLIRESADSPVQPPPRATQGDAPRGTPLPAGKP